jgi:hypothetical protein
MKNILFILILFLYFTSNAQEFKIEEKSIIGIFETESKNKEDIYASIDDWISLNYNTTKNVQMSDLNSGKIIIKGINEITYKSLAKALDPGNMNLSEYASLKFNHIIEIDIHDSGYTIAYHLVDLVSENVGKNNLFFKCIDLDHTNEIAIIEYNKQNDLFLIEGLVDKKKREEYRRLARPMFEDINNNLIFDLKLTMSLIEKSVSNPENIAL